MALKILKFSDFEAGRFAIASNQYTEEDFLDYAEEFEQNYIEDLLGVELGNLFLSDLIDGVPQEPRFQTIFNRLSFDFEEGNARGIVRSEGIKRMLQGFVWSEYVKDQNIRNTIAGSVQQQVEVAKVVEHWKAQFTDRYNSSLLSFKAIQTYVMSEKETYPEFNGIVKEYITPLMQ